MAENEKTVDMLARLLATVSGDEENTTVEVESNDDTSTITITTSPKGRSLLIGKGRSMFQSLKTIFASLSGQDKHHYILRISGMRPGGPKND